MIIYYTDKYTGGRDESHSLLEEALSVYTGDRDSAGTLTSAMKKGEHGKPFIEGFSCFSISHTGRLWAVLFDECECGLDIQLSRSCNTMAIAHRVFADEDVQWLKTLSSRDEEKARKEFFRIWTRREALVKALGGSVADSDLPSVLNGKVNMNGCDYFLADLDFPKLKESDPDELRCAICIRGSHKVYLPAFHYLPEEI